MKGTSKNLTAPRSVKEVCMYDIYSFDWSLSEKKDTRKNLGFSLTAVCIVKDLDLLL